MFNMFSGIGHFLGNLFHPGAPVPRPQVQQLQRPVQPVQRPQPQQPHDLGSFLHSIFNSQPVRQVEHVVPQAVHLLTNPIGSAVQAAPQVVKVARTQLNKPVSSNPVTQGLANVPNVHLQGLEQLTGHPVTIGSVAGMVPGLTQATKPNQSTAQFTKNFVKSGVQLAPNFAPELKIAKVGEGANLLARAGAKFINNAAPAVATSVPASLATGQRNPVKIAQNAAAAALFNGGAAAGGEVTKGAIKAAKSLGEGGYIAGPNAQGFGKAVAKGQTFVSPIDNKVKYEGSDAKASIRNLNELNKTGQSTLGTVLNHKALFSDYPHLKDTPVVVDNNLPTGRQAHFDPNTGTIHLNPNAIQSKADLLKVLVHENDHAIGTHEGFAGGTNAQAAGGFHNYQSNAAEQSAHDSAQRLSMSQAERQAIPHTAQAGPDPALALGQVQHAKVQQAIRNTGALTNRPAMAKDVMASDVPLTPHEAGAAPASQPKMAPNALTQGGKAGRQNLSEDLQGAISGQHAVRSTKQLAEDAVKNANSLTNDQLIQAAHDALNVEDGKINDATVALAHQAIERADAAGRLEDATAIHDALSNHLTKNGQTIQAATLLYNRTPQGMLYKALKDLKKGGTDITPELHAKLQGMVDEIKGLPQGSDERAMAIAKFQKEVADRLPQKLTNNAIAVWKAGLLSGTKTQGGNFLSNATFGALNKASDIPAALVDKGISLATGKRTKTVTLKGIASGTKQGLGKAGETMRSGVDQRNLTGSKFEQRSEIQFKNKLAQNVFGRPSNLVFRGMAAADQPFYYAALKNSLSDQAKAEGLNQGLKGASLNEFIKQTVAKPSEDLFNQATLDAQRAVLGEDNQLASAVSKFSNSHPALQVLVPFSKVPSNFINQTIGYTPAGPLREVFNQARSKTFDQRALSTAIGKGITGTGLIALGADLAGSGQLSGSFPTDPKEQARWKAEGITQNSVKLGNKWISLNYLGPLGLLLGAGKNLREAGAQGEGAIASAASGLGQGLLNQSFLQGLSGFSDALKDPTRNATSFIKSELGSLVPAWSNDIANATDAMQRKTNSYTDAILNRIPGLRESLQVNKDAFGNPLAQPDGSLNAAFNPLKPSKSLSTPLTDELNRLKSTGKDNFVFPTTTKTVQAGGQTIKLDPKQQDTYNTAVGQAIQATWYKMISDPAYKSLSDTDKANALQKAATDVTTAQKVAYLVQNGHADLAAKVKLNGNASDALQGQFDPKNYLTTSDLKATDPRKYYQQQVDQFNRDQASGKLTSAQAFTKQQELGKMGVTSKYSNDVTSLYGMSKTQLNVYFKQNPDQYDKLYPQLTKLDQELYDNGWTSSLKFKNGLGSAATARSGGSTRGRRTTGTTKLATASKRYNATRLKLAQASSSVGKSSAKVHVAKIKTVKVAKPKSQFAKLTRKTTSKKVTLTA